MPVYHRTQRLQMYGEKPEVTKLFGDRYRIVVRCLAARDTEAWYNDNHDQIFADFGTLYNAQMLIDGIDSRAGEAYPNMALISNETGYTQTGEYLVTFVYETLTDAWVKEQEDEVSSTANGLRILERSEVSSISTAAPYDEDDIGVSTVTSNSKTLYLAALEDQSKADSENQIGRIVTRWAEAGIISVQQDFNNGLKRVSVQAFNMTSSAVSSALSEVTASHELISQAESDYAGIKTTTFQYQINESFVESYDVKGFKQITISELSASPITADAIGSAAPAGSPALGLFLSAQRIDNGGVIKVRESTYVEAGVISIRPLEEDGFSLAKSYSYVTTNAPASSMTGLTTPDGVALPATVTWFEPIVNNADGYPTYTQQVILINIPVSGSVKIHSADKFFTVTEPGVMDTYGTFSSSDESGAAARYPAAVSVPKTYRKKGTVDVYLTNSPLITETEVAFTEEDTDWCSIAFESYYTSDLTGAASASGNWRSFPNYLKGPNTNDTATASILGKYAAYATSYGEGSTSYNMTGIYRVEVDKYTRSSAGTQLYLKTIVTFS